MAKGHGKSSATSATRKKHQKKTAASLGIDLDNSSAKSQSGKPNIKDKTGRGKKDGKKEPRIKEYIPPVKPARVQPDPLEVGGLARRLPPELVVVLKNVGKKAHVTKINALEELRTVWVEKAARISGGSGEQLGEEEDRGAVGTSVDVASSLVEMLPAWMHYIPSLFIHPSRRVRLSAISVHSGLLKVPEVREQVLFHLQEIAARDEVESVMGSWCMLMHDIDNIVATSGKDVWNSFVRNSLVVPTEGGRREFVLEGSSKDAVFGFVQRAVLDPLGLYAYLNPPPASNASTPPILVPKNHRTGGGNKSNALTKQQQFAAAIAAARKGGPEERELVKGRAEEDDESESDRKARIRIGGLGGLRWFLDHATISGELLRNPLFWTILHHAEQAPYVESERNQKFGATESFGFGQPNVRKAGWSLLMQLLNSHRESIPHILPVLGCAVLRSAWVEPDILVHNVMWQPLLTFLKSFPSCWDVELARCYDTELQDEAGDDEHGEDGDEDDDEDGEQEEAAPGSQSLEMYDSSQEVARPSLAYREFLQFLQLGCSGSPLQGYPAVVIILSTIPSPIIASTGTQSPLEDLFTSFWAALDARALSSLYRAVASAAFLSAVLESVAFLSRRLLSDVTRSENNTGKTSVLFPDDKSDVFEGVEKLVRGQFGRLWEEIRNGQLKVEEKAGARIVGQNLDTLERIDSNFGNELEDRGSLRTAAWDVLGNGLQDTRTTNPVLVATFLKVLFDHFKEGTKNQDEVRQLVHTVLGTTVQKIVASMQVENRQDLENEIRFLQYMLEQFREGLFDDMDFAQRLDELLQTHTRPLVETSASFIFSYLVYRGSEEAVLAVWHAILGVIAVDLGHAEKMSKLIMDVSQVVQNRRLPNYLKPRSNELDDPIGRSLGRVLSGSLTSNADLEITKAVLAEYGYFISETGFMKFVETISSAVSVRVELLLGGTKEHNDLATIQAALELLDLVALQLDKRGGTELDHVLPDVFLFGYFVPECASYGFRPDMSACSVARRTWEREINAPAMSEERRDEIIRSVRVKLRDLLIDTQVQLLPEEIFRVLAVQGPRFGISSLLDLFPSPATFDIMYRKLSHDPIDSSLAAIDSFIPLGMASCTQSPEYTDSRGFSAYARITIALLRLFSEDRNLAKLNIWALRHFIALSIYASDYQKVPAGISPVFDATALTNLSDIIVKVQQIIAYLSLGYLAGAQDGWRQALVRRMVEGKYGCGKTKFEEFVEDVIRAAAESDSILDARVLRTVLENVLEELDTQEAEEWIGLARRLEKSAPETSMAIIKSITETGAEPNRLDRYRNEQAAELLGIKPSKINTVGFLTLRRLVAAAPGLESDIVFLPQNRAVNVVKACQAWVTLDEADIDQEVESAMTLVFTYLAPILQSVPGSHWEFIWDVLENNLEISSFTDDSTLPTLLRSLRLVVIMEDLVRTNKTLRAEWEKRRKSVLEMIRDQALVKLDNFSPSLPRSTCKELALSILRELPDSLVDENTLSKMCHVMLDPSLEVQKMGYVILRTAARKRTEHLVIEAGVDTDSSPKASIPSELLDIVRGHVDLHNLDDDDEQQNVLSSLLGWMLIFDLFQDASFKVKSGYIEQLRNLELINSNFIPLFLAILRLTGGLEKAFKLNVWAIDQFYIDLLEPMNSISVPLLMAHLYYRALLSAPALIYSWLSNCKDRQLSTAVSSYTSQHFSPVIIEVELAHIKGPVGRELSDDSMSIKVAAAINEVMASYLVDEHQLEIKLKIPADWPLHKIEVKDIKRVGVDTERWRAWILAIQQTIWSHNGRITDGLSLFKRNATLHFEGQVECAICYSIISVMDGSLPKKPCKTCKNKFHAVCLYKWFETSNASTCPLCRSEIILR